jgi:hypothetical protein
MKLKLKLEDLAVDSFDTTRSETPKGTVFGEQCTCYTNCTCPGCPTCYASCDTTCATCGENTCAQTCGDTCGGADTCDLCNYPPTCYRTNCGYELCCPIP